jgi:hypothetical protein
LLPAGWSQTQRLARWDEESKDQSICKVHQLYIRGQKEEGKGRFATKLQKEKKKIKQNCS